LPVVLAVQNGAAIFREPMLPEVLARVTEVVPVMTEPPVSVIVPEPLAESVTAVPVRLLPRLILALPALVDRESVPEALIAPEVDRAALFETEILLPLELPLPILSAAPLIPVQVTLPVVLNVRLVVVPVKVLIFPEPEARFKFVAVIAPDV